MNNLSRFSPLLFIVFLIMGISSEANGQLDSLFKKKTEISEIRKNNYQIDLGFNRIQSVWSNTSSAAILVKKKFNYGDLVAVNSLNFYRAFFDFRTQTNFNANSFEQERDTLTVNESPANYYDLSFGFGLEKQFQNRRFVHYYGIDLIGEYFQANRLYYNAGNSEVLFDSNYGFKENVRTIRAGVTPFAGIKYYLTDQFSFGLESGIKMAYFNSKFKQRSDISIYSQNPDGTFTLIENRMNLRDEVSNGMIFNFLGIRYFTISYSFK